MNLLQKYKKCLALKLGVNFYKFQKIVALDKAFKLHQWRKTPDSNKIFFIACIELITDKN